jgi:hypothetical protein
MPAVTFGARGHIAVASAEATYRDDFVLAADGATASTALVVRGMPKLQFWAFQTVGVIGATIIPQFTVSDTGPGVLEWLSIAAGVALGAAPVLLNYEFAVNCIRLVATRPVGQATTIQYVLSCAE